MKMMKIDKQKIDENRWYMMILMESLASTSTATIHGIQLWAALIDLCIVITGLFHQL